MLERRLFFPTDRTPRAATSRGHRQTLGICEDEARPAIRDHVRNQRARKFIVDRHGDQSCAHDAKHRRDIVCRIGRELKDPATAFCSLIPLPFPASPSRTPRILDQIHDYTLQPKVPQKKMHREVLILALVVGRIDAGDTQYQYAMSLKTRAGISNGRCLTC